MIQTVNPQQSTNNVKQNFYNNSFHFLRLLLAFCVVISHSFALYFGNESEPRLPLNGYYITLGNFAVYAFFVISGFVITHSWLSQPEPKEFLKKRINRIFPGLLVCLFLTITLFAPFLNYSGPQNYFLTQIPNAIKYFALNATGFNFVDNIGNILNQQFTHNEINPVLWTIRYEIIAYILILMIGYFQIMNKKVIISLFLLFNFLYWISLELPTFHDWLNQYFMFAEMFSFLAYFFAGSLVYFYKDSILINFMTQKITTSHSELVVPKLNKTSLLATQSFSKSQTTQNLNPNRHSELVSESPTIPKLSSIVSIILSIITLFIALQYNLLSTFGPITIAILVLNIGYVLPFQNFKKFVPDISFGVYIYGWLVQLIIIKYFREYLTYPQYISVVFIATIVFGLASHHLVEKSFMK